jgi:aspartate aminotransferase
VPYEEFKKIYELTSRRGIWLITDECYHRFLYDIAPFSISAEPGAREKVIVAGSLSKTYAMTGWRIGFVLAPPAIIQAILKLQSHSTSNPTSIAQKAALEAVRGPQDSVVQMLAEYRKRREYVVNRLRGIEGLTCNMPEGAFYAYPNVSGCFRPGGIQSGMEFAEKLLAQKAVAVVPGEAFGTHAHFRLSYATSMHELERGIDRIAEFVQEVRSR